MNENELLKELLKNQRVILECLWVKAPALLEDDAFKRMKETDNLIQKQIKQSVKEPLCDENNSQLPKDKPVKGKGTRRYSSERASGLVTPKNESPADRIHKEPKTEVSNG